MGVEQAVPVSISHDELWDDGSDIDARILEAFGPQGLGLIVVRSVPTLPPLRASLLSLASTLATSPASRLRSVEDAASGHVVGWSRGVELFEGGKADDRKGSFYANPMVDAPALAAAGGDAAAAEWLARQHPAVCRPNVWPSEDLPELRPAFRALGGLVVREGRRLAERCDCTLGKRFGATSLSLSAAVRDDATPKARLLHYYARGCREQAENGAKQPASASPRADRPSAAPPSASSSPPASAAPPSASSSPPASAAPPSASSSPPASAAPPSASSSPPASAAPPSASSSPPASAAPPSASSSPPASAAPPSASPPSVSGSWCGWHSDTGALTGLVSATYRDPAGAVLSGPPDPAAGLHVRRRDGSVVRVAFPPDALAFQLGEAAQILSGGRLRSTPHCVVAGSAGRGDVSRQTLAVFLQPRWDIPLLTPAGTSPDDVGVPGWEQGIVFGDFAQRRFSDFRAGGGDGAEGAREGTADGGAGAGGTCKAGADAGVGLDGACEAGADADAGAGEAREAGADSTLARCGTDPSNGRASRPLSPVENAIASENSPAPPGKPAAASAGVAPGKPAAPSAGVARGEAAATDASALPAETASFRGSGGAEDAENAPPAPLPAAR